MLLQCPDPSDIDVSLPLAHPEANWAAHRPVLLDFGRSVDTRLYPDGTQFTSSVMADDFECLEMREGRPWTFQLDSFAAAACAYFLLHSEYMELQMTTDGWRPKGQLRRYWQMDMWSNFFAVSLNVPQGGPQPDLTRLADAMSECIDSLPQRQKLRQAMQSQHAMLREAGLLRHKL